MARLTPTIQTIRALLSRTGNECFFPGCNHRFIDEDHLFIGQICHIEAAVPGGPRYRANHANAPEPPA